MTDSLRHLVSINLYWVAVGVLNDGLVTIVLPLYLLTFVPFEQKNAFLGALIFVGLGISFLVQPLAGSFSDRFSSRWGRRRPLIVVGTLFDLVFLIVMGLVGGFLGLLVGFVFLQLASNLAQAAHQALLPDLVSPARRGLASGLKNFMDIGGAIVGFVVGGYLMDTRGIWAALAFIGLVLVVMMLLTLVFVREPVLVGHAKSMSLWESYFLDVRLHGDFAVIVASRFLFLLGAFTIKSFFEFFVMDTLQVEDVGLTAGAILGLFTLFTIGAALLGGWASDRVGRQTLMVWSAVGGATAAILFIFADTFLSLLLVGSFMGLGVGAYGAVNWAMATDLAPRGEEARFLGLANYATAGAAAMAGLAGFIVDYFNAVGPGLGYRVMFILSALSFVGASLILLRVRGP